MWHYAQHFAMSDNAYTDTYGPSTPGALEVVSGQTNGMQIVATTKKPSTLPAVSYYINDGQGGVTMINDVDPGYDVCSVPANQAMMTGKNIGDLLNAAGITWGGFMGGFDLQTTNANGTTGCKRSTHSVVVGSNVVDYIPHHNWFQYYASTANPTHARPSSLSAIGYSLEHDGKTRDPANHQYGLQDFYDAVKAGNFPSVSYRQAAGVPGRPCRLLRSAGRAGRHRRADQLPPAAAGLEEHGGDRRLGRFGRLVRPRLRQAGTIPSFDAEADQLDGPGKCGAGTPLAGVDGKPVNGRCGPGTRIPFLVISPWAKPNSVIHTADLPGVGGALHRGQLAARRAPRRRVVRRRRRIDHGHVRLPSRHARMRRFTWIRRPAKSVAKPPAAP